MAVAPSQQSILYVASHGMEDSYRATLIFAAAKAAYAQGVRQIRVALLGEATWLVNKQIQQNFSLGAVKYSVGGETLERGQLATLIDECVSKYDVAIGV